MRNFVLSVFFVIGIATVLSGCSESLSAKESDNTEKYIGEWQETGDDFHISFSPLLHVSNPEEENMAGLLQEAAAGAIVRIQVGDVTGSGVLWDVIGEKLVIATAAHILKEGNGVVEITFADGRMSLISGYYVTDTDLAFLYVDTREFSAEQSESYCLVQRDAECAGGLQKGEGVIMMGASDEAGGSAYEGIVIEPWIYAEDFAQYMIWVDGKADLGMSGGGLFDEEGHLLGLLCGTNEEETVALPLSVIEAVYQNS